MSPRCPRRPRQRSRHVGLRRLELGVGVAEAHAHLGKPGLRGGKLLAGLVELLADLIELRRELVDPGLDLVNGRLGSSASASGEDRKPTDGNEPRRDRDTAAKPGSASTKSHTHRVSHTPFPKLRRTPTRRLPVIATEAVTMF